MVALKKRFELTFTDRFSSKSLTNHLKTDDKIAKLAFKQYAMREEAGLRHHGEWSRKQIDHYLGHSPISFIRSERFDVESFKNS